MKLLPIRTNVLKKNGYRQLGKTIWKGDNCVGHFDQNYNLFTEDSTLVRLLRRFSSTSQGLIVLENKRKLRDV